MQSYISILKFQVSHSYYNNSLCKDLLFTPTPATLNLIKGHRLVVKYRPAGFEVFAPLSNDKLQIPIEKDVLFQWFIKSSASNFQEVTAFPDTIYQRPYRFSNQTDKIIKPAVLGDFGLLLDEVIEDEIIENAKKNAIVRIADRKSGFAKIDLNIVQSIVQKPTTTLNYTLSLEVKAVNWQYLVQIPSEGALDLSQKNKWKMKISGLEKPIDIIALDDDNPPPSTEKMATMVWKKLQPKLDLSQQRIYLITTTEKLPYQENYITNISILDETKTEVFSALRNPQGTEHGFQFVRNPKQVFAL